MDGSIAPYIGINDDDVRPLDSTRNINAQQKTYAVILFISATSKGNLAYKALKLFYFTFFFYLIFVREPLSTKA